MKTTFDNHGILSFLRKNWFKLALAVLALYVFFKKDLRFQIQVQAPEKTERKSPGRPMEKITDSVPVAAADGEGVFGRFQVPVIGNERNRRDPRTELSRINETVKTAFLKRFAEVARNEQAKFSIPASVILGVSLYQSCAGKRDITLETNNYFALPCPQNRQSACAAFQGTRYRRYNTAWESFRDFSYFSQEHFANLKGKNYKAWVEGMARAGFGEDEQFAKNVIGIIETYQLHQLDGK